MYILFIKREVYDTVLNKEVWKGANRERLRVAPSDGSAGAGPSVHWSPGPCLCRAVAPRRAVVLVRRRDGRVRGITSPSVRYAACACACPCAGHHGVLYSCTFVTIYYMLLSRRFQLLETIVICFLLFRWWHKCAISPWAPLLSKPS